ncbi:hypothetical protein FQN50_003594 [Emmonsiellopsis sp. PD_5]|nr:hypothetical protein FQN50_003594 [Emmonsiellopsis sp. PD_5]
MFTRSLRSARRSARPFVCPSCHIREAWPALPFGRTLRSIATEPSRPGQADISVLNSTNPNILQDIKTELPLTVSYSTRSSKHKRQRKEAKKPTPQKTKKGSKYTDLTKRDGRTKAPRHKAQETQDNSTERADKHGRVKAPRHTAQGAQDTSIFEFIKQVQNQKAENLKVQGEKGQDQKAPKADPETSALHRGVVKSSRMALTPLETAGAPVPGLSYGLERVLFNPGVYQLQDLRTGVYNFDPYLGSIMPVHEFDFTALNDYITSSRDETLHDLAIKLGKKYIGSSSSMTSVLSHFHYLLSSWRTPNTSMLSQGFPQPAKNFTKLTRSPAVVFLRYKNGVYAIDADKEFDTANILMNLGKSMEKLLTVTTEEFERYRKSSSDKLSLDSVAPETYHYTTCEDFLMRAQLDAYDPRLPGTGMFDLKTRAVCSIRMNVRRHDRGLGYQIKDRFGEFESFEREYFDMIRAAFLKYSLQVRIGRMDGIFVAYHNIERIFGFQYVPLSELDLSLHGQTDTALGDAEFQLSVSLWNKILEKATNQFPNTSLRFHFDTRETQTPMMYIFAEPVTEEEIDKIQTRNKEKIDAIQRSLLFPEEEFEVAEPEATSIKETTQGKSIEDAIGGQITEPTPSALPSDSLDGSETVASSQTTSSDARSPDYYDSSGSADVQFLQKLESANASPNAQKELFAVALSVRNVVNGRYVPRPENFSAKDKWDVEYVLSSFTSPERAWRVYAQCQKRREKALSPDEEDDSGDGEKDSFFLKKLHELSKDGRIWREKRDLVEQESGTIVLK